MGARIAGSVTVLAALLLPVLHAAQSQLPDLRSQNVSVIAVSPDGSIVATGERATTVKLWDSRARRLDKTLRAHNAPVSSLAFSPDGAVLATGSFDQWIRLWDITSGQMILELGDHPGVGSGNSGHVFPEILAT
jgi:WD40 repeat protein